MNLKNKTGIKIILQAVLAFAALDSWNLSAVTPTGTGPFGMGAVYPSPSPSPSASPLPAPNDPQFKYQWGLNNSGNSFYYAPTYRANCQALLSWQFGYCMEPENEKFLRSFISGYSGSDIHAIDAWTMRGKEFSRDCSGVRIGVVDTGADSTHPDLGANINVAQGRNFVVGSASPAYHDTTDWNSHGTLVSGIIGAVGNNKIGISGVCWKADITPIVVFDEGGFGSASDMAEGIAYAAETGVKVINTSFQLYLPQDESGQAGYEEEVSLLRDAVQAADEHGALVVAAAGNDGNNNDIIPIYPSSFDFDNVISVAASDNRDTLTNKRIGIFNSNFGIENVDLTAPGFDIYSTIPLWWNSGEAAIIREYDYASGTSVSAPFVTAVAAAAWGKNPTFTHHQIKDKILASIDRKYYLRDKVKTGGRLSFIKAMRK